MAKALVLFSVLFGFASSSMACGPAEQDVKPFQAGRALDDGDDDEDDKPAAKSKATNEAVARPETPASPAAKTVTIDTTTCNGVTEPEFSYTAAEPGALPVASGGAITDGTWVQQSAELENAAGIQLTEKRHGMIRFSGNRFAWHDTSACLTGTFTTDGANLNFDTTDGTATVTYTADGASFTLKRSADEAYHYVKQ